MILLIVGHYISCICLILWYVNVCVVVAQTPTHAGCMDTLLTPKCCGSEETAALQHQGQCAWVWLQGGAAETGGANQEHSQTLHPPRVGKLSAARGKNVSMFPALLTVDVFFLRCQQIHWTASSAVCQALGFNRLQPSHRRHSTTPQHCSNTAFHYWLSLLLSQLEK